MKKLPRILLVILLAVYILSPVDAFPGPVDDVMLTLLSAFLAAKKSGLLSKKAREDDVPSRIEDGKDE